MKRNQQNIGHPPSYQHQHQRYSDSQSQQSHQQPECIFCPSPLDNIHSLTASQSVQLPTCLFLMMNQALSSKHMSQSNTNLTLPVDILLKLEQPTTAQELQQYIAYKEHTYEDQHEQNMKREYKQSEFNGKIGMLSDYYKFHKDIPHVVELGIEKILAKYYDRKREYDYKCIKKKLKEEEGLSITSVEESVTENSETVQQKSRYSTLLGGIQGSQIGIEGGLGQGGDGGKFMSDSNLLEDICREIGKALPKIRIMYNDIKGSFYGEDKNFESYVRKQQQSKKPNNFIKASKLQEHLKRKSKNIFNSNSNNQSDQHQNQNQKRENNNYLNFKKQQYRNQQNQTIKNNNNKNQPKIKSRRTNQRTQRIPTSQDKKKFIYNTNIKIQIQNAMFYPNNNNNNLNNNNHNPGQFGSAGTEKHHQTRYDVFNLGGNTNASSTNNLASRKSLVGKINALNQDRYKTPVSKIYQPQQTDFSTKYRKRSTNSFKKDRMKTKQSREFKDFKEMLQERQKQREQRQYERIRGHHQFADDGQRQRQRQNYRYRESGSLPKRIMSSHNFKKPHIIQYTHTHTHNEPQFLGHNQQQFQERTLRQRTISVAKLKLENQRSDIKNKVIGSVKRGSSSQNLRRRSMTLSQNKHSHEKIVVPLTKYSSSQMKDNNNKFKGISIKDLLTKKLNIKQR